MQNYIGLTPREIKFHKAEMRKRKCVDEIEAEVRLRHPEMFIWNRYAIAYRWVRIFYQEEGE